MSAKKSKNYLVIGSDEYDFFESIDNGATWRLSNKLEYEKKDPEPDPRPDPGPIIIDPPYIEIGYPYYIKEPDGPIIKYPDKIILNKPIPSPHNWPIIVESNPPKDIIHDVPETFRIEITYDDNDPPNIKNKELIKKYDLYELLKNKNFSVDDLLLYILNDIIIPYLCFKLMSTSEISSINNDSFDINNKFFTNSELYITFDGIDFETDVGMQPLRKEDTKLYKEIQNSNNELANEYIDRDTYEKEIIEELKHNDELKFSFAIIDAKLNIVKEIIQKQEIKKIESVEESYEGLNEDEYSMMKYFYSIKKGADESIMGTIINSIFSFNNSKRLALLKTSILNVAYNLKESIKYKLTNVYKMILSGTKKDEIVNGKLFKNILNFNLIDEWNKSLWECILNYYTEAKNNIFAISNNNDKDLITAASSKYREIRDNLIDEVSYNLPRIDKNKVVNDTNIIELNTNLNNLLTELMNDIKTIIKDTDFENKLNNLLIEFSKKEEELLKDLSFINNILYYYSGIFKEDVDSLISEDNNNIKNFLYFDKMDYYDELYGLSQDEINRTFKYYENILNEFKKRCVLLYKISGENIINSYMKDLLHISSEIKIWANNLLISSDKERFINDNNLSYLKDNTKDTIKDLFELTNDKWIEEKGKI